MTTHTAAATTADLGRLTVRALRHQARQLEALLINALIPVAIMVVFVYVFGGAISTGASGLDYIDFVVPGVLLLASGYGAALTAVSICEEMTGGMIDRFRTLPIRAWVVPASHVVASLLRNVAAAVFAFLAALALGFRPGAGPLEWVLALVLVCGFVLAMSAVAVVWGLLVSSTQAASAISFVVLFLPYLSNGFVPAETMPAALRGFAEHQPFTPLVDTLRALLLGQPTDGAAPLAAAWLAGLLILCLLLATVLFRRRTAR